MTTRRILKKQLVDAAEEVIRALELCLGKRMRDHSALGRAVERALFTGKFQALPVAVDSVPTDAFHVVFEPREQAEIIFRGDNADEVAEITRKFSEIRRPHKHVAVSFTIESLEEVLGRLQAKKPPAET